MWADVCNDSTTLLAIKANNLVLVLALILPEWPGGSTRVLPLMPRGSPVCFSLQL